MSNHLNISISMNAGRVIWQLGSVNAPRSAEAVPQSNLSKQAEPAK